MPAAKRIVSATGRTDGMEIREYFDWLEPILDPHATSPSSLPTPATGRRTRKWADSDGRGPPADRPRGYTIGPPSRDAETAAVVGSSPIRSALSDRCGLPEVGPRRRSRARSPADADDCERPGPPCASSSIHACRVSSSKTPPSKRKSWSSSSARNRFVEREWQGSELAPLRLGQLEDVLIERAEALLARVDLRCGCRRCRPAAGPPWRGRCCTSRRAGGTRCAFSGVVSTYSGMRTAALRLARP